MNNRTILKKCIDELNKDAEPDISYVRGMLETLHDMQPEEGDEIRIKTVPVIPVKERNILPQIEESLDLQARNAIEAVKKLAGQSSE